ncbi:spidroin-2-like isoform X2 [Chiloscyllium plagiosum]|nr:spidroin-2-like isoform X2 [Chiloscyllium plagiosum]
MELPGLRADTLRALLRFMYTAQIQLPRDETAEAFLRAARGLGILGLSGGSGTSPGSPALQGDSSPPAPLGGNARGSETEAKPEAPVVSAQAPGGNARVSETDTKPEAPVVSVQVPGGNAHVSKTDTKPKAPVLSAQVPSGNARVSETDTKPEAPVVSVQVPGGNDRVSENNSKPKAPLVSVQVPGGNAHVSKTDTKPKAPVVSAQAPVGNARVSENNSKPKAPVVSAQAPVGNARVSENNSKPKATSVTTTSSSPQPRLRGKRAYTPAELPASTLVTSWRRMRVVRPVTAQSAEEGSVAGESPFPRRQWRRRKGQPAGDPAPPAVPVTDQLPTPPPHVAHPGRYNPSEPDSPEPTEVTAARPGREGCEPETRASTGLGGALQSFRETVPSCAPTGVSDQAGRSLSPGEGHPAPPGKEAQQTRPAVSGPPPSRVESSGWGCRPVSEQGPPRLAGDISADREGVGIAARLGKRPSGQGASPERPEGITKVKLQKLSHSREWVVIPVPEWQETGLQPHTGNRGRGKGVGASRRAGRRKASINLTHPLTGLEKNDHRPEGLGGDRRLEGLEGDHRPEELGGEQGTEGLGLGDDQGTGGLGLGVGEGTGGLGLGVGEGTGGLGLGIGEGTGGLDLGVSQGFGGLDLGVDQGTGGLGLGDDQGTRGLGLGVDQVTGGLGLGDDQGTGALGLGVGESTGGLGLGVGEGTGGLGLGVGQGAGGLGLGVGQGTGGLGLGVGEGTGGLGLGVGQGAEGLGLGVGQGTGGLGLGVGQGAGGLGLGVGQGTGGLGLGVGKGTGGLGLGVGKGTGGLGLGVGQGAGGLGLGVGQGTGGLGLGVGLDTGGLDLGVGQRPREVRIYQKWEFDQRMVVHQTLGGLVPDGMLGPGERAPVCNAPYGPEQRGSTRATMFPWETGVQGVPDRPDQCGLALPQITDLDGASLSTGEWGFARLCARAQGGISASAGHWESAWRQFAGQHRMVEDSMVSSPSSEDEELDVGDSRDAESLPLVTVRPEASPPPSPPRDYTEIDVVG